MRKGSIVRGARVVYIGSVPSTRKKEHIAALWFSKEQSRKPTTACAYRAAS